MTTRSDAPKSDPVEDASTPADNCLLLDFCGDVRALNPTDSLMFGRRADLSVDDNPYLHRVVGRFVNRQGLWWLQNLGTRTVLEIRDGLSASRLSLAPGQQLAVIYQRCSVCFTAGPTSYELEVTREGGPVLLDELGDQTGTATIDFGVVPLSAEQHVLLVALCEPKLRTGAVEIPTNQALADRLGWTITKFNRKLDHLCAKLAREGVRGVRGGPESLATDRRQALVEHAITVGLVSADDLGLITSRLS